MSKRRTASSLIKRENKDGSQSGKKDVKSVLKQELNDYDGEESVSSTRSTRQSVGRAARRAREDSFSSGMSLDVLAQVATETLEKEPVPQKKSNLVTKRSVRSLDLLSVQQIRALSDKALVGMFAELNSNEMSRNYTFTCYLMPEKCSQHFSSFGNETKAKMSMKAHLLSHLEELQKKGEMAFAAEPIQARKKRLAAEAVAQKKAKKKLKEWAAASGSPGPFKYSPESTGFTSVKSMEKQARRSSAKSPRRVSETMEEEVVNSVASDTFDEQSSDEESDDESSAERGRVGRKRGRPAKKPLSRRFTHKKTHTVSKPPNVKMTSYSDEHVDVETMSEVAREIKYGEEMVKKEAEKTIAHNEQFVLDLLSQGQPYHDHSYTTVFGKRHGIETLQLDAETLDELAVDDDTARTSGLQIREDASCGGVKYNMVQETQAFVPEPQEAVSKTLTLRVNAGSVPTVNNVHIPIIRLARVPCAPDGTPIITAEEVVIQEEVEDYSGLITTSAQKPYPPMPKSELARKGKVAVPEEELSSDDEGGMNAINTATLVMAARAQKDTKRKMLSHGTAEWERKLALKCIRDLRGKKRDEEPLVCKICKDKEFTATATLMYHYRSHAGIKPFVCLICHTTFTRQHSLNYHMLIHNNQSRFTCKDCGRKFRHPSHFKEHLRRHTGETPFHCADCPLRFKTRNTYKRHLKTRHGKLLTAEGIKSVNPPQEYYIQIPAPQSNKVRPDESDPEEEVDVDVDDDEDYVQEEEEVDEDETEMVEVEPEERIETVTTTTEPQYIIHTQEQPHSSHHIFEASQLQQHLQYQPPPPHGSGVVVEPTAAAAATQLTVSSDANKLLQFCAVVNQEMM